MKKKGKSVYLRNNKANQCTDQYIAVTLQTLLDCCSDVSKLY